MRSSVVFPQPDGPTMARNCLSGISRLTSARAVNEEPPRGKTLVMASNTMSLMGSGPSVAGSAIRANRRAISISNPVRPTASIAADDDFRGEIALSLHQHITDADETTMSSAPIRDCQPSPAPTRRPETTEGKRPRQQHLGHHTHAAGAERARCLHQMPLHQMRAAIGVEHARGERPVKITITGPPMPVPNQSAAKGTQASGAI